MVRKPIMVNVANLWESVSMSDFDASRSGPAKPDAALTRRSLIAAAGILATVSPVAVGKALASRRDHGRPSHPGDNGGRGASCFLPGTRIATPAGEVAVETFSAMGT